MNTNINKSKRLKLVAKIELFIGFIMILVSVILYSFREKIFSNEEDYYVALVFLVIGLASFMNVPILYFLAKKEEEKNPSPVEY